MEANFACAFDHVVARRSASVWTRRVENCYVGEPSKARVSWKPVMVMVELLLWLWVAVVRAFVVLFLRSRYDIF